MFQLKGKMSEILIPSESHIMLIRYHSLGNWTIFWFLEWQIKYSISMHIPMEI